VTINTEVKHGLVFKGRVAWRTYGVNWKAFSEDAVVIKMPSTNNIRAMVTEFHKAMIEAAKRFVGTVKPGRHSKTGKLTWSTKLFVDVT
jgi:hypothetical protein